MKKAVAARNADAYIASLDGWQRRYAQALRSEAVTLNAYHGDPTDTSSRPMPAFVVKALEESTWQDFARLVEKHNGVWGGCWCMAFHSEGIGRTRSPAQNRSDKACRVREGRAHAALVFDGAKCVGWCQFGAPDELPRIKHGRAYREGGVAVPDWRITCLFVDREFRGQGVAALALKGALKEMARLGGGTVESFPESVEDGRSVSSSFLHNATIALFEREGFARILRLGKNHWVVAKVVRRATARS